MSSIILLDDIPLIEGPIADYKLDPVGILYSYSKNPKRTVANISENIALVKKITGNKRVPLLIYLCDSPVPDKETRNFSTEQLPKVYTAMAMVSKPGLSKLIMNILFRLKKPPIPMRSFTDDREAREWLMQFL
ncbi:MAG: STAS/SEC14 domain-containing protein [Flavobacteriales bacterium]|nr:STAS/SEC14 domain-containing protein [Flavobacteriales bacterium]